MACKQFSFAVSTGAIGTQVTVSGIGFRPALLKFRWSGRTDMTDAGPSNSGNDTEGRGFALENLKNYCWSKWSQQGADPYTAGSGIWNTSCIVRQTGVSTATGKLKVVAMTADGFTYEIQQVFANAIAVIGLAVSGIEVDAVEIVEPGATGVQTYTTAFRPTFLEVIGSNKTAWDTMGGGAGVCQGAAFGSAADENAVHASFEDTGLGTGDDAIYCRRTECLAIISPTAVLCRARVEAFNEMDIQLNWLERNSTRVFVLLVMTGRHFIAQGLTQTNTNPFSLTGMTWVPEGIEMVSGALPESPQDTVSNGSAGNPGFGLSDGFGTGPADRAVIYTRLNPDGNAGASRQTYQHEFDEIYADADSAGAPVQLGLGDISTAFTADTVTLVMDDADPQENYFFLIVHGPPVIEARQRLVKYLHNTFVDRGEGRPILRDAQGRDLPLEEIQVDNYMFSAAFMFPTPVKRHSNIEENHLHYIETLSVRGDKLTITVERESLFGSVMRRLSG